MTKLTEYPDVVTGYELNPQFGYFGILEPKEATNLCKNPSFEVDATDWSAISAGLVDPPTVARSTDEQRRGAWSYKVTTEGDVTHLYEGIAYEIDLTADIQYGIGVDLLGNNGEKYRLFVCSSNDGDPANALSVQTRVISNGYWQRLEVNYGETSTNTRYICIEKYRDIDIVLTTKAFYVDGLQVEVGEISTYFDGDSLPYGDDGNYVWIGSPHESQSFRSGNELSSGVIRNLKDKYNYSILSFFGLGLDSQDSIIIENALVGGGSYQRGTDPVREYTLVGALAKDSLSDLLRKRAKIERLLLNGHTMQSPITVRAEMVDDCNKPFSQPLHLRSIYAGGFEGTIDNLYQERSSLQFLMDRPDLLEDGEEGDSLNTKVELASLNYMARKDETGTWDDWDTGADNSIQAIVYDRERVYVCGSFTQVGSGPLAANGFAYWDIGAESFYSLFAGAGANNTVLDIAIQGNGNPWICGSFTAIDGVASTYIAYYDIATSAWVPAPVALPGEAYKMIFADDGSTLYVVGVEAAVGGYVYEVNAEALTTTDLTAVARAIGGLAYVGSVAVGRDGTVFVGGGFTSINGVSANNIAKYDGSTWVALGDGLEAAAADLCGSLVFGGDGLLYVLGDFDTADGISANNIASYNGETFVALGQGVDNTTGTSRLFWFNDQLYVSISGAGCSCPPDNPGAIKNAIWTGTNWIARDFVVTAGTAEVVTFDSKGIQYVAGTAVTDMIASGSTEITNSGSSDAYPVIIIKGELVVPGAHAWNDEIYEIRNISTNQIIKLELAINQYETIMFDFRRGRKKIISDIRGDLTGFVTPSSDFSNFRLAPGDNYISIWFNNATNQTSELISYIYWPIAHDYLGGAIHG